MMAYSSGSIFLSTSRPIGSVPPEVPFLLVVATSHLISRQISPVRDFGVSRFLKIPVEGGGSRSLL